MQRPGAVARLIRPSTGDRSMKAGLPFAFCAPIFVAPVAGHRRAVQ